MREKYRAPVVALLILCLLSSCARVSKPEAKDGKARAEAGPRAATPPLAMKPATKVPATASSTPAADEEEKIAKGQASSPPLLAGERAFGLAAPLGPILAEDLSLGALQDWRTPDKTEAGALAVARRFLAGLAEGKLEEACLLPERFVVVSSLASPLLGPPPPLSFRLGAIEISGDGEDLSATARLRLKYPQSPTAGPQSALPLAATAEAGKQAQGGGREGELGLRLVSGTWYIESIVIQ